MASQNEIASCGLLAENILSKALNNKRLTLDDTITLLKSPELLQIGATAQKIRRQRHPERIVTYVVSRNINYTNVCTIYCSFCAFYRPPGHEETYTHGKEIIFGKIQEAEKLGATQILMQGGLNPELPLSWYCDLFASIKTRFPNIWSHSLSAPEVVYIAQLERMAIKDVISRLHEAGLDSIPGGGAEMLTNRVRNLISPLKNTTDEWLEVHRSAHELGMMTTATMMLGHLETEEDIAEHLMHIRNLQDETGGFTAFIPWLFQPGTTPLGRRVKGYQVGGFRWLRVIAVSRLALDNFPHIQGSWLTQGPKLGQMGLNFGADDFGDTVIEDNVVVPAGAQLDTDLGEMTRLIEDAGFTPQKRNTQYESLPV